ncbi:SDR family NAD(P)-dependent oxidoreductase [Marinivivus vitaminiproducens]|uniref:SDR family NAD(P)-dependent oxidoreductase n=1 Tax=Marinivivus vitaminiproducens TaxID=3035935 RepID=UPI0027A3FB38|nr:SDR family NAD(P)-dependent oxidoreductase [Geminicoccaceae bacterium SCSIO 64248]
MNQVATSSSQHAVAIIGMAARLPGARDVDAFWRNLLEGRCAIRRPDDGALRALGFSEADLSHPRLTRAFGVLEDIDAFDAAFFGYPRARAEDLDPQQRLLLEVAWHAMEHAGYARGSFDATVGTYMSITQSSYRPAAEPDLTDSVFALTSRDKDYAASRIAYKLDLTGPSMMIQSASSGSLAAVHAAIEGVLSGQCDMAIAGGASIALPQGAYLHAPGLMLSPSGVCRAFDAAADGAVPGNGVGIVVLKPLDQALRDGDTIFATIRGSALTNDGADKSDYLAPSVHGQARAIGEALAVAEVDPATIGYIETHGTGTAIGDPIEIRALSRVLDRQAFGTRRCALGSLKPNIGHLHVASGIAGLIKAALAIHHGVLPPSIHFDAPNAELGLEATPFYVNTEPTAWHSDGPRRAGVSAFGLGGTNVHVVLEQAPIAQAASPVLHEPLALMLSAQTHDALERLRFGLAGYLRSTPDADLSAIAWTLAAGRARFPHRMAVLCTSVDEAVEALKTAAPLPDDARGRMADLARAFVAGETVDPEAAFAGLPRRRVPLPLYPFEKTRYWSHRPEAAAQRTDRAAEPASGGTPAADDGEPLLPWLQSLVGTMLRQEGGELDPDATYETFGIDSLLVNSITQALQARYPTLRATALFEHTTLRRLARHLAAIDPSPKSESGVAAPTPTDARDESNGAEPIAIVGMAGRYPGAGDVQAFWWNLRAGQDAITEVPADRWAWRTHVDPDRKDRSYTRWGGFIADADRFDPLFFGITPREAKLLDPQQRVFLETAWHAIEDAGYTRAGLKAAAARSGGDVGVFAAAMHSAYRLLGMDAAAAGQLVQSNHWSIANRVSYAFDFAGPSLTVDTACSASLAAVHLAVESLRRRECGAAIVGGVNLILHPQQPLELCRAGMLSKGPRCSAFGEDGDGFVQGEGVGVIVLKPLAAAIADGDRVLAVIRGSAMNAGGKTSGFTVPNPNAQADVVASAIRRAGVRSDTIGYVECHGTGTSLGDPIEIAGLDQAFQASGHDGRPCAIGSVKSNIGHLEAAAGIAGLTKAVLQLQHAELIPSLHASPRNPRIDFASGPFRVQERTEPWQASPDAPRRAGISSFGAGGANVHVVLEEAPVPAPCARSEGPWLLPLSARDDERLAVLARRLRDAVLAQPDLDPADIAYTLGVGREAMEVRAALIVADRSEMLAALADILPRRPVRGAGPKAVKQALAARDLPALAEAWLAGADIDWARLFTGGGRRLSLPGYPFLRERHWLPEAPARSSGGDVASPSASLLAESVPTVAAEARWRVPLAAGSALLADHRVEGRPTLPGVATIVMATEAARHLCLGEQLGIRDLTWLRPVEADPDGLAAFVVRDAEGTLRFDLVHKGAVCATGSFAAVGAGDAACGTADGPERPGQGVYDGLAGRGLVYGEAFRCIDTLRADGKRAVAHAQARGGFDHLCLDPGLLDAALQVTAALLEEEKHALFMPFAVSSIDVLCPPPPTCRIHAERRDDGSEPGTVRFDVAIVGLDGRPCVVMQDVIGRVRPAAAAVPPCYTPLWRTEEAPPGPADRPARRMAVIADPGHALHGALVAALPAAEQVAPEAAASVVDDTGRPVDRIVVVCTDDEASVDRLFMLVRSLIQTAQERALRLDVLGHVPDGTVPPWIAAAIGLVRVAARECPAWAVRCALVDRPEAVDAALSDRGDPLGREVLWRNGERRVRALLPATPPGPAPAFRTGGTYLVLGGAGGIGLELAVHLARTYRANVALVGRTPPNAACQARIDEAGSVAFFAADACVPDQLARGVAAARARFGPIHGAFHSAIVMQDQALAGMASERFHAALDVKTHGTINLVDALAGEPLDWLALFSSANSFAANAGQANYVAGCAFKDAYAAVAAKRLGCPVTIVNWGFWGEVGRVADPAYRSRLAKRGVHPIGTREGLAATERLVAGGGQTLVLKADESVLRDLGLTTADAPAGPAAALSAHADLDRLARQAVAAWAASRWPSRNDVASRHHRLYDALEEMVARAPRPLLDPAAVRDAEADLVARHADLDPHVRLLRTCIDAYDAVLRGRTAATDVMFPGSSLALVEGIYRGDRLTALCNERVAQAVRAAVEARRGRVVRVLEVGAGTGGTSAAVLAALQATGATLEYTYTDVSRAFLLHGERRFGASYPFVRFDVLDLARDPEDQGYAPRTYDVVLGANVVHVTADLVRSAGRLNRLVAPGGVLVLYEMTAVPDFATATFGLLDGWWTFTDTRLPHAPLLGAPAWSDVLRAGGFASVELDGIGGGEAKDFRHTIIAARASEVSAVDAEATTPAAAPAVATTTAADNDALVETIRNVVADTLQMRPDQLDIERNFADYGADSIISVDLIGALGERFAMRLKPTILFSHPTIARLAAYLAERGVEVRAEATEPAKPPVAHTPAKPKATPGSWVDDIAIVGMAGRFPGADDVEAFWTNIEAGIDSVRPVPADRWDHAAVHDPKPAVPGKTQCPDGGFLDDVRSFDPLFFNLSPSEATSMDPQQRLFLQEAWHALEHAGYGGSHPAHARCGVFVGTVAGDYDQLLREAGRVSDAQSFMGNASSMLAARIAYRLDLHGPCLSVDTACSSSLLAVHLACESLLRGESDMALAGGVAVLSTPSFYVAASQAGMLSPTGRCRTLDAAADGFVPGEAAAAIVLKRRADAERDGDTILALIKGAGVNQDGASNGITAPNGDAQAELLRAVYDRAAIDPASVSYVEMHGTGTRLGDPVEIEALRQVFADGRAGRAVGSVKANVGHTLPAAGIVGLIKLVQALRHRTVPPMAHFARLNEHLASDELPFDVPTRARPWTTVGPLRGAVSSFGFSGTNVHAVLEEAPPARRRSVPTRPWQVAVLSARTDVSLQRLRTALADWLESHDGQASLADICGTLARGRSHFPHRIAFVAHDLDELRRLLLDPPDRPAGPAEAVAWCRRYLDGGPLDWEGLYPEGGFGRVPLPGYPFEKRRCWPEPATAAADTSIRAPQALSSPASPLAVPMKNGNGSLALFEAVLRDLGSSP